MQVTMGLRRAARVRGRETAVLDGTRRQTWADVQDRVARLAGALRHQGLQPGDRVAILMLNGHRYLELYYAVPWAGGLVMPLNIRLSPLELLAQVTDGEPAFVVVDDTFARVTANLGHQMASVRAVIHAGDGAAPGGTVSYESLVAGGPSIDDANVCGDEVYGLFYTGGTTAASKGVMLTHANITVNAYNIAVGAGYRAHDIYLHSAPMFHLADSANTFAVTMMGAAHAFIPVFDPSQWAHAVETHGVTAALLVPTMINAVVNWPGLAERNLASLRFLLYGASPISASLLGLALERLPCDFVQGYGMTELSPVITLLPAEDHVLDGPTAHRVKSAGLPVPNADVVVLDEHDRPVPPGTVGEICARGPIVMKGYWRKPEETARAIRDGYMHTGDLGYMDEDGYVYLVDRAKDMIVSGGENVYSVEVEAALYAHPAVLEAAVFGIPDDHLGEQVHAAVVLKDGRAVPPEELIAHCRQAIAPYKCPKRITLCPEPLPKSGAGKILKRELRSQYWAGLERQIH
ncbi:MAG: long-chain-fatty-acid--CoA ligase [Vicinamibacterales bacterium]